MKKKVDQKLIDSVKRLHEAGFSDADMAEVFPISLSTIGRIRQGDFTMEGYLDVMNVKSNGPLPKDEESYQAEVITLLREILKALQPAVKKQPRELTDYQKFIREHTKGGKMTVSEAAKLWNKRDEPRGMFR